MASSTKEIQTYFGKCRCCLNYGYLKNMWEEHYWEGKKEIYVHMLVQCFALSWEHTEESMEHDQICETCVTRLRDAHQFKKIVLESQEQLLGTVEDEFKIEKEEYEIEFKKLSEADSQEEQMYIDDPNDPDYVDPDDPGYLDNSVDPKDSNDPNDMQYEKVEYLEDEDIKEALAAQESTKTERRTKGPIVKDQSTKWPRKLPKCDRNKTYKQYTEEELRKCLEAVKSGQMTAQEGSAAYKIPRKTIAKKLNETKDNQNGNTTKDRHKTEQVKTEIRRNTTIFWDNAIKCLKKLTSKHIKIEKAKKPILKGVDKKDDIAELLLDIKTEENDIKDRPVNADEVRTKYKAIVKEKFKNINKEPEKFDVNELDKHKNNIKHILESTNATLIKGFWGSGYSCCFCNIQKEQPSELKAHNLETHSHEADNAIKVKYVSDLVIRLDITDLKCKLCQRNIDSLESLTDHLFKTHDKNIHTDIKNHIIPFKFDTEGLHCVKCKKEFKYFKLLSEHMSEHYKNYECPKCDRTFINKQSMQTHSYRHKTGVFKCWHCPKVFDTRPKRSVHERVTHTLSNKTRKCTYCDERFSTKDLVQKHEAKIHGAEIPVFNCQACNKSYNSQSSLMTHRKRYHLMLRPHKCSFCDMAFFSKIELRSHTVTHTKSRDFKCNMCSKSFGTRCSLNQHVRGHLDDRRFKCDSCERAFVHRTAYKVHMRSKHGKIV